MAIIPLTTLPRRAGMALLAAGLLATGATGCEPPPPPPAFTVDPSATGADADPGDRICATAEDACSLQAAVEEANALDTPTDIWSSYDVVAGPLSLEVTGSINLKASGDWQRLWNVHLTIAEGAKVVLTDGELQSATVHGTFAARRAGLGGGGLEAPTPTTEPLLDIGPTGRAMLTNTIASPWDRPLAVNAGMLVLHSTTVNRTDWDNAALPTITTEEGAETRLAATYLNHNGRDTSLSCGGVPPVSYGYNLAPSDVSCGLDAPGDLQGIDPETDRPYRSEAGHDAIPVGVLQCGEGWSDDIEGEGTRPGENDLDFDDVLECDIGADEG